MRRYRYRPALAGLAVFLVLSAATIPQALGAGNAPPRVTATTPAARADNVDPGTVIQATFNTSLDAATINSGSFVVSEAGGTRVSGSVSYDSGTWTASFAPSAALQPNTRYVASVTGEIRSSNGVPFRSRHFWYFVTSSAGRASSPSAPTPTPSAVLPAPNPDSLLVEAPAASAPTSPATTMTGPLVIDGVTDKTYSNITISNPNGNCVVVKNSARVLIDHLKVGPCNGQGVQVLDSSTITIQNSVIATGRRATACCDVGDGIYAVRVTGLTINNNTVQRSETNIAVLSSSNVQITSNKLNNPLGPMPRGQQVLITDQKPHPYSTNVTITGNILRCESSAACDQADAINLNSADTVLVASNDVQGGRHDAGCAIIADYEAYRATIRNNWVANIVNCGIGITDGTNHLVENNTVNGCLDLSNGFSSSCIYVWAQYPQPCRDIIIRKNSVYDSNPFWNGQNCQNVTVSGNSWQ